MSFVQQKRYEITLKIKENKQGSFFRANIQQQEVSYYNYMKQPPGVLAVFLLSISHFSLWMLF